MATGRHLDRGPERVGPLHLRLDIQTALPAVNYVSHRQRIAKGCQHIRLHGRLCLAHHALAE